MPKLEKIILSFSVKSLFSGASSECSTDTIEPNMQVKSFLIFYTLLSYLAYLNFHTVELKKITEKNIGEYSLKVFLSNWQEINNFLYVFCFENVEKIKKEINIASENFCSVSQKSFLQRLKVSIKNFSPLEDFFSFILEENAFKEFKLQSDFLFLSFSETFSKNNLVKNHYLFWNYNC
jgi:hypothetical protein